MLAPDILAGLTGILPAERLFTDPVDCYAYAYDNSRRFFPPQAVVFPLSAEDIQAIVQLCNQHQIPLTARGRGTGTAGGSQPEQGGIVLSLERMNRILKVDPANKMIVCEPGVLNQEVQNAAKAHG
ncbi:MAG TPA: FAD-binding oxidoreductase, partial [Methylophilaceae bacterium]